MSDLINDKKWTTRGFQMLKLLLEQLFKLWMNIPCQEYTKWLMCTLSSKVVGIYFGKLNVEMVQNGHLPC